MSDVLNLDLFQEKFKEIQVKGKVYKVPADIPALMFFELMEVSKGGDISKMKQGLNILYDIFKILQPDLEYKEFSSLFSMEMYTAVINWLFADISVEETMKMLTEAKEQLKDGKKKATRSRIVDKFDFLDIVVNFCLFYHVPIIDYKKVLAMNHRLFLALLEKKNKNLQSEQKGWQEYLKRVNGK